MGSIDKIKRMIYKVLLAFFHCWPIQTNKILFWANGFHGYGDSPKCISDYLQDIAHEKYKKVWVFEYGVPIPEEFPDNVRVVHYLSIDYLREISTAKVIICNTRTGPFYYFHKRPGQIYIQTWHSSLRLKMIEGDATSLPQSYVQSAKEDSEKIDLLISGSRFSTATFRRAFWYQGEILESGTPRCDIFFGKYNIVKEKVYRYYGLQPQEKLVLYAPTFRANKIAQTHGIDLKRVSEILAEQDGRKWNVACRYHPNLKDDPVPNGVISMTSYPDMQELIAAADLLITDFSSCMFDMAICRRPCILYVPDLQEYTKKERKLYFDIEDLPFPIAQTMPELVQRISDFDVERYKKSVDKLLNEVGSYEDGHATERVVDYIERKCGGCK